MEMQTFIYGSLYYIIMNQTLPLSKCGRKCEQCQGYFGCMFGGTLCDTDFLNFTPKENE